MCVNLVYIGTEFLTRLRLAAFLVVIVLLEFIGLDIEWSHNPICQKDLLSRTGFSFLCLLHFLNLTCLDSCPTITEVSLPEPNFRRSTRSWWRLP